MNPIKFNREAGLVRPEWAVETAVDDHRVEAARIDASVPEMVLGVRLQAKRHGDRIDYYLDDVRTARARVVAEIAARLARDNAAPAAHNIRHRHMRAMPGRSRRPAAGRR